MFRFGTSSYRVTGFFNFEISEVVPSRTSSTTNPRTSSTVDAADAADVVVNAVNAAWCTDDNHFQLSRPLGAAAAAEHYFIHTPPPSPIALSPPLYLSPLNTPPPTQLSPWEFNLNPRHDDANPDASPDSPDSPNAANSNSDSDASGACAWMNALRRRARVLSSVPVPPVPVQAVSYTHLTLPTKRIV